MGGGGGGGGVAAALVFVALLWGQAVAADGSKLYAEKTCVGLPRQGRQETVDAGLPEVAGQNVKYAEKQMQDIKNGARANGNSAAMKGVMDLVSDEEIKDIAAYVSKMKP